MLTIPAAKDNAIHITPGSSSSVVAQPSPAFPPSRSSSYWSSPAAAVASSYGDTLDMTTTTVSLPERHEMLHVEVFEARRAGILRGIQVKVSAPWVKVEEAALTGPPEAPRMKLRIKYRKKPVNHDPHVESCLFSSHV